MTARVVTGAPGGKRAVLADAVPLPAPLLVQVFPIYACNLRCRYCHFSIPRERRHFVTDWNRMNLGMYKQMVDDLLAFPVKPRVLRFVGIGEPLLHGDIVEMVRYAFRRGCAERTEILTNGLLLAPFVSDELIRAGLDRMVISVQGTSAEKYREVCGRDVDFDKFLENLRHLHYRKGPMQVHIKAIDCALDGPEDVARFYDLFGSLCDTMAVEKAGPIYPGVEYNEKVPLSGMTQYGVVSSRPRVCSQPFASMQINPDGKVVPCYSAEYPVILGDVNRESLLEIWEGPKLRGFRLRMLEGRDCVSRVCATCKIIDHRMSPEDSLDAAAERLREVI